MIRQLGRFNFDDLALYIWRSTDFGFFQEYIQSYVKELIGSGRSAGILYGGKVAPVSELTVSVSKMLVLFSDGQLVTIDDTLTSLPDADPDHPRIDRLEVTYDLKESRTGQDINKRTVLLDQHYRGHVSVKLGEPGADPEAPEKSAGSISLALIHVGASQAALETGDVDQTNDTAAEFSEALLSDSTHKIRVGTRSGMLEVTNDGENWFPIATIGAPPLIASVPADQSDSVSIPGLVFDKAKCRMGKFTAWVRRKSDDHPEVVDVLTMFAAYSPASNTWRMTGQGQFEDTGVSLSIDPVTGHVQYTADPIEGDEYEGELRVTDIQIF